MSAVIEQADLDGSGPLLRVLGLTTKFTGGTGEDVTAVHDVHLTLSRGETLGIVGESGSGKSVLVRTIMGLIGPGPHVTRTGSVILEGIELTRLSRRQLRLLWGSSIGMILQDPMTSLNPVKRVGVQITETIRRHRSISIADAKADAVELLRSVGIADPVARMKSYPHELSGGMRQRVTIAIALSGNPHLLICDEPTTALDVTIQEQILDLLDRLQRARNTGTILVTHDLGVVATRTDRIVVMYAGRVVESAPTKILFEDPAMPYTRALIDSLPTLTQPSHQRLKAIKGNPPSLLGESTGCRFASRCVAARTKCFHEEPELTQRGSDPNHIYRCWFPVGSPEYIESARSDLGLMSEADVR